MNNPIHRELFIGFRSTPILITLIFILGLCMALDYFVEPNEDVKLLCSSNSYDHDHHGSQHAGLRFEIERVGSAVKLQMTYLNDDKDLVTVSGTGTLVEVSAPVLTYKVLLDSAALKSDLLQAVYEPHMQETVRLVKKSINKGAAGKGEAFYIKVLEMDKTTGFVTIQLSERNALWACKIQ